MRTRPAHHAAVALVALAVLTSAAAAYAGVVTETEGNGDLLNNTIGTAQNLDAGFTSGDNPDAVGNSGSVPGLGGGWSTSSVTGAIGESYFRDSFTISADVDFYEFTLTGARTVFLDIDSGGSSDLMLWLFESTGLPGTTATLRFYDDQSGFSVGPHDAGSSSDDDPFIGQISLDAGTYYAAVSAYSNPALVYVRYYDGYFGYRADTALPAITGYSFRSGVYGTDGNGYGAFSYPTGFEAGALGESGFLYSGAQPASADTIGPYTLHITVNPEPSTLALFGLGALGLVGVIRRRRRRS